MEAPLLSETDREHLHRDVSEHMRSFCEKFRKTGSEALASEFLSEERAREHLSTLQTLVGRPLKGASVLEIGSGYGMFLVATRRLAGADSFGVEPGTDDYMSKAIAQRLLLAARIDHGIMIHGQGEDLPFASNMFDVVYSSNVLEHVRDPRAVIHESFRVIKPGGRLVFVVPNYRSFWEGHYRLPWLPIFNWLPLARFWVRLFGRDPAFLDTLHFVTPSMIRRWLSTLPGNYRVLTMGEDVCAERLRTSSFGSWGGLEGVRRAVGIAQRWGLTEIAIKCVNLVEAYTPIILVVEKTASEPTNKSL